jgi:hypothetical protein
MTELINPACYEDQKVNKRFYQTVRKVVIMRALNSKQVNKCRLKRS